MSPDANAASRFRGVLASERRSADLYSGLADAAMGERREVLTELAAVERKQAAHWAAKLTELGEPVPPPDRPGLRTVVLSWLPAGKKPEPRPPSASSVRICGLLVALHAAAMPHAQRDWNQSN
jgi:hypothetical protein